mgnify:CR=1 FL=1
MWCGGGEGGKGVVVEGRGRGVVRHNPCGGLCGGRCGGNPVDADNRPRVDDPHRGVTPLREAPPVRCTTTLQALLRPPPPFPPPPPSLTATYSLFGEVLPHPLADVVEPETTPLDARELRGLLEQWLAEFRAVLRALCPRPTDEPPSSVGTNPLPPSCTRYYNNQQSLLPLLTPPL